MLEGILGTVFAVIALIAAIGFGHAFARDSIAQQCDVFGRAHINQRVYVCIKQEPAIQKFPVL